MAGSWTHTALAQQLVFGAGSLDRLPELVKVLGARKALLVTTEGRLASPDGERVVRLLGRSLASTFSKVQSHVPVPLVQQAVLQARRDAIDLVVSFGGGSCADLGKAVCFFLEQEAGVPGASHVDRPAIPHLSIPTTYSGAELTPFFGMTDPATKQKQGAAGPTSAPLIAVYDPDLTTSTPSRVRAETGMNALAHCVEAAYSPYRTPEAEAIALAGARTIGEALPLVVADPEDADEEIRHARAGAALAGRCLLNAGMGVHHGLAQLVGGRTGIPHGLANAILLTHAVRFNAQAVPDDVARIGAALGGTDAAEAIDGLRAGIGLPGRLSEVGVLEDDLDAVARLSQANHNVARNPRPVTEDDALAILRAAW